MRENGREREREKELAREGKRKRERERGRGGVGEKESSHLSGDDERLVPEFRLSEAPHDLRDQDAGFRVQGSGCRV